MEDRQSGDLLLGVAFVLFGAVVGVEALRMPYWERETFFLAPGFVPLLTGVALSLLGVVYGIRAGLAGAWQNWAGWFRDLRTNPENKRLMVLLAIVLVYTVGLVGRMGFFWATLVFHGTIFGYLRIGGWLKWLGVSIGATLFVAVLLPRLFEMPLPEIE